MIITISGVPGAGDTTVSKIVAEKLGYKLVAAGELFREEAKKRGLNAEQFWEELKENKQELKRFHNSMNEKQKDTAMKEKNVVFNGKLSAFYIPNARIKIFLTASFAVRSKRIAEREGVEEAKAAATIQRREEIEKKEWNELYGIDYVEDINAYDYLINTEDDSAEQVAEKILGIVKKEEEK